MVHGADALLERPGDTDERAGARAGRSTGRQDPSPFLLRNRITGAAPEEDEDGLIRQLAADRLRELRDDGVTMAYIARRYGVTPERMETLYDELIPSPPG